MKKNLIILSAMVAAALASCSTEVTPAAEELGQEIGFNAVAQKATKAVDYTTETGTDTDILNSSVFGSNRTFSTWGFYDEDATSASTIDLAASTASNFMNGIKIEYTGGKDSRALAWRNAEAYYYWPAVGAIGFYALAPSAVQPTSINFGKLTVNNYAIADNDNTRTTDLMYGYAAGMNRGTDLPLTFNHALSQIVFNIKTDDDYTGDCEFKVNSIKMNNLVVKGDFSYFPTFPKTVGSNQKVAEWTNNATLSETAFNYYTTPAGEGIAVKTAAKYGKETVMVPQNLSGATSKEASITINFTLSQGGKTNGNWNQSTTADVTVKINALTGKDSSNNAVSASIWEMGKKYVYTLNFKLNEITFAPEATDWVVINVDEITIGQAS